MDMLDLVAICWDRSPDDAKIKQKMVFASSRDALRRSLVGIATEIQGTDTSEVEHETGEYIQLLPTHTPHLINSSLHYSHREGEAYRSLIHDRTDEWT